MVGKTYGPQTMFKSYYVVWKPQASDGRYHQHIRLNRTMQYGNALWEGEKAIGTGSLNRTMQYGNKSVDDSTQVGSEV